MSEYVLRHSGKELDDAIEKVHSGYIYPSGTLHVDENGNYDISEFRNVNVNVGIPDGYMNTADADATSYDIYNEKTAYAGGKKITGKYKGSGLNTQYNCNSSGCSTSQLVINCGFEPRAVCVVLNSENYAADTVISVWMHSTAAIYHSRTSSGVIRSSLSSKMWSFDSANGKLTVSRPNSSYSWSNYNYRVFAFR